MKRYSLAIFCIILSIYNICAQNFLTQSNEPKTKIAIYTTGDVDAAYKKIIGSKVTSAITQSDQYVAVERTADFLNALSQEHDYQTSGAVSDNQIVKIGQQFGVKYVAVLDISEIFESIFISARMIDVKTGLIKASAEIGTEVQSMNKLIEISSLIGDAIVGVENYKIIGPYSNDRALYQHTKDIPEGYHVASKPEMERIIKIASITGYNLQYPIYCSLVTTIESSYDSFRSHVTKGYFINYDGSIIELNTNNDKSISTYWQEGITRPDSYVDIIPAGFVYIVKNY